MSEMKTVSVPRNVLIRRSPRHASACPARLGAGSRGAAAGWAARVRASSHARPLWAAGAEIGA